jgi:signal transduction histidine kinase/ActR/RegA family two-component response regulator
MERPLTSEHVAKTAGGPFGPRLARALRAIKLSPPRWPALARWASAPAATLLTSLVQAWLFPHPGIAPFVFLYVGPVLAAWIGGRFPGLLAVVLSAGVGNYSFLGTPYAWDATAEALTATALFVVGASVIALLCASFRDAVVEAERTAAELQARYDEARRARERLRESEARYSLLFESIDEGFCVVEVLFDDQGEPNDYRFLVTNPAFVTQTGLAGAQGRRMRELAPRHEEHWFEAFGRIALTGEPARFQERAEQLHRWYDVYAFRVGRPEDRQVAILFNDITRRREADEALRAANQQLAEADRRKDEFLAVLSHELRTPLAPIKNSLFVLDRAAPGGEQARRARAVMERQVDHMTRLVSDLLDVSRITHGKIRLQRERIDLREVVGRTLEDLRSVFAARGIELHGEQPERPVWVDGDATRLGQALGNLLHNSAKFTNEGGVVSVTVRPEGETAVLRVRDTGVGIAPVMLGQIFQPFTQADRTLDRSRGGLGLGLALVKGVAELHGGSVAANSEGVGRGSEFTLRLPVRPEPAAAAQPKLTLARRPRRVLIIEDNEDAAESLKVALEMSEHEVALALDGPRGLELARAFKPEVVLCDIGLPGMDGYEVARALRSDDELRDIALVALTGYALPEDVERAKAAGFDRHIAKPPDLGALERVLSELPGRRAA